jgi:hypothetical protein
MEIDYNMLVQNHGHYNMLFKKITLWGGGVMVKNLTLNVELRSSSLHACNLGYFGLVRLCY